MGWDDDTWDMDPEEERRFTRMHVGKSIGFVVVSALDDWEGDPCDALRPGGSVRFVDRPAADIANDSTLTSPGTWLLVLLGNDGPTSLIGLGDATGETQVLTAAPGSALSPTGRYLVGYRSATRQIRHRSRPSARDCRGYGRYLRARVHRSGSSRLVLV